MNFKQLREVIKKYKLASYINASLSISVVDDKYLSMFNIVKERFTFKRLKYFVFKNEGYDMRGTMSRVQYFEDKDAAAEYAWELFKEYVFNMLNETYYSEEWVNLHKSLVEIINTVEKEYI